MAMPHQIINTPAQLANLTTLLGTLKLPITVEWAAGRDRTRDQNALQWMWAGELARQRGDCHANDIQAEWKLIYGIPILREDSADFRETYDAILKPLTYEQKSRAMRDLDFGVTRKMKVRQMVRYLDTIQREMLQFGYELTDPDPELRDYQARYRAKQTEG